MLLSRALKGDAVAQFQLGKMYEDGNGVKQDKKMAYEWYLLASQKGYPVPHFRAKGSMIQDDAQK